MSGVKSAGAQRVGWLDQLDDIERLAVDWLRNWDRNPTGQDALQEMLVAGLGENRARSTTAVFEDLMDLGSTYGRRRLCRHGCRCRCLGADEAIFAHLVAAAANGDTEDAALLAALVVRPDMALCFAGLAAEFGMGLMALRRSFPKRSPRPMPAQKQTSSPSSRQIHTRPTLH